MSKEKNVYVDNVDEHGINLKGYVKDVYMNFLCNWTTTDEIGYGFRAILSVFSVIPSFIKVLILIFFNIYKNKRN